MINYQDIIEQLENDKVITMLEKLDIPYEDKGEYLIMPTVCHHASIDEASWKLYYYKNTHIFYCYTEDGAMSIFSFLKHYYETKDYAYDWFNDIYELILGCSTFNENIKNFNSYHSIKDNYEPLKSRQELTEYPKEVLDAFVQYYPIEWLNDGITKETMNKFNIRFSISQNKIIIPHYDVNDRLIGIRARALNKDDIDRVFDSLRGEIEQTVPKTSAVHVNGRKLYHYAHMNQEVELPKRKVEIKELELISYNEKEIVFKTTVSKGTYVRVLGETIAEKLGTVGHLTSLRRTKILDIDVGQAHKISDLDDACLIPCPIIIKKFMSMVYLTKPEELKKTKHGGKLSLKLFPTRLDTFCVCDDKNHAIAIYKYSELGYYECIRGIDNEDY